jgi:hypothetical protein
VRQIKKQKAKEEQQRRAAEGLHAEEREEEDEGPFDDETIIQRVADFIKEELPHSILIREFNGNFVYQVLYNKITSVRFHWRVSVQSTSSTRWKETRQDSA